MCVVAIKASDKNVIRIYIYIYISNVTQGWHNLLRGHCWIGQSTYIHTCSFNVTINMKNTLDVDQDHGTNTLAPEESPPDFRRRPIDLSLPDVYLYPRDDLGPKPEGLRG